MGKPSPVMMRSARKLLGLQTSQTVMVGDTMETDIHGGVRMGYTTALVLTGSSSRESLGGYAFQPDFVAESVPELDLDAILRRIEHPPRAA